MYRLLADVFNDAAMILECLSPAFPKPIRVCILATSSALKALCGVAAGSSKASLSAHFARWGNLGELNAKDSSQETVISLLGMLAGSAVVSMVTSSVATWSTLMLLLSVHLGMNYRAVRAVSMRSLNRQRANIVFANLLTEDVVLTPAQVARRERVFEWDGVMRDLKGRAMGHCKIGVPFRELVSAMRGVDKQTSSASSVRVKSATIDRLLQLFDIQRVPYVVWVDKQSRQCWIALRQGCSTTDQLQAWYTAYLALVAVVNKGSDGGKSADSEVDTTLGILESVQSSMKQSFAEVQRRLLEAGWDLSTAALETRSGSRIAFDAKSA